MTYIQGFVVAVPADKRDAYRAQAAEALPMFKEFGATRMVEAWADDVPEGKVNDFRTAVQAKADETVVFSWIEYPDKATHDEANAKMASHPAMEELAGKMVFDASRMIYAGFDPIVDVTATGASGYVDGFIVPVPPANRDAYRELAQFAAGIFLEYGAVRVVEAWGDAVPDGKVTDFNRAAHAQDGEQIVFSWIEWPSKEARTKAWDAIMQDERMKPPEVNPFDGKRMIYGGFLPILDA